jgi:hypothetical protein
MARRGKIFELLDVVKFAVPNAATLQAQATSHNLAERLALQLPFCSEVRLLSDCLVGSTPE